MATHARVVLCFSVVACRTAGHASVQTRMLEEYGTGVVRVGSAPGALGGPAPVAEQATVVARFAVAARHIGVVVAGTTGKAAVGFVVEVVADRTAFSGHAVVGAVVASLTEEGTLLADEVDGAVDELAFRTRQGAGVFSLVLVVLLGAVVGSVATLAVFEGGSVACHAAVDAGFARIAAQVHVIAALADGNASTIFKEEVDTKDSATGSTVIAGSLAGLALCIADQTFEDC